MDGWVDDIWMDGWMDDIKYSKWCAKLESDSFSFSAI